MPKDGGTIHHCRHRKTGSHRNSANGGFCKECHTRCYKHPETYFTKGSGCPKCRVEQQMKEKREQERRERERRDREEGKRERERDYWGVKGGRKKREGAYY